MKSKSINSKVITGAILASLIIGSSSIGVFAADTSNTTMIHQQLNTKECKVGDLQLS